MARIDHSDHNHPNTPAARAACRKAMANGDLTGPVRLGEVVDENGTPDRSFDHTERQRLSDIHVRANVARQKTRDRERSAARVARRPRPVRTGRCVQAELHRSPGKCACGFRSPGWKD